MGNGFEEDPEKSKYMRFLKMVERKNEATANRLAAQASQSGLNNPTMKTFDKADGAIQDEGGQEKGLDDDDPEERDVLLTEGLYELHRKRKIN